MLKTIVAAATALALSAGIAAAESKPVRIGFSIAKTGLFSKAAPSQMTAYELWREQVNAKGGLNVAGTKRRIVFVWYDDESKPAKAAQIYEKLITNDRVDLLLAPWGTPHHLSVAGVVEKHKFPMVGNTAASVAIRKIKPGYIWFPTSAIPDRIATELAKMAKQQGVTSVAVIANVLPFSQENRQFLIPALKAAGIAVKVDEKYPPNIRDMTPILTKIKNAKVDAIIGLSYPDDSFLYMKQAREIGIKAKMEFLLVGPTIPVFAKAFGKGANGILTIGHWSPYQTSWPRAKAFFDAYRAKFKSEPDYLDSALAYMSVEILEQAVAKAGLDKEKLRKAIAGGSFETINGAVRFKGVENTVTPTAFLQIQAGRMHIVWPKSIATATYQSR
ncbi:MAG TPA: amino acid ABC transporter substrate-binding protein [Alphaproteobacteria bacterium]|nr:amino acid ABC transporter substrate-binding protein [Alphaproteobacteria bacterium]